MQHFTGVLGEYKGINFPSHVLEDLPAVSEKDALDLQFALDMECDFVSVSCIRNINDVEEVRMLIGNSRIKVLSKIEVSLTLGGDRTFAERSPNVVFVIFSAISA